MYLNREDFKRDFREKLLQLYRPGVEDASDTERYIALGTLIKDYMAMDWYKTETDNFNRKRKSVYYFSLEFLIGRLMDSLRQTPAWENLLLIFLPDH